MIEIKKILYFDNTYMAIPKEALISYFGSRFVALEENPVCLILVDGDITKLPYEQYQFVPQDHPAWAKLRVNPKLLTASQLLQYLHAHFKGYAMLLDVTNTMVTCSGEENEVWKLMRERRWQQKQNELFQLNIPNVPSIQTHGNMAAFCMGGKEHEGNDIGIFLYNNPRMTYVEKGLMILTDDLVDNAHFVNQLTHKVITAAEIKDKIGLFGASPDGIVEWTDEFTGKKHTSIIECKARSPMIPINELLPGIAFKAVPNVNPYKNIKGYYLIQFMLQMLVCNVSYGFWMVYTPAKGMVVWKCHKNKLLLEMMFTLLIHMYEEVERQGGFDDPNKFINVTQNDYFESEWCPDDVKALHDRFIKLTSDTARKAEQYAHYMDNEPAIRRILGMTPQDLFLYKNYRLPVNHPPEMESFTVLQAYCYTFGIGKLSLTADDDSTIVPVDKSTDTTNRARNVAVVMRENARFLRFFQRAIDYLLNDKFDTESRVYHNFVTVRSRRCQNAELLLNWILNHYYGLLDDINYNEMGLDRILEGKINDLIPKINDTLLTSLEAEVPLSRERLMVVKTALFALKDACCKGQIVMKKEISKAPLYLFFSGFDANLMADKTAYAFAVFVMQKYILSGIYGVY